MKATKPWFPFEETLVLEPGLAELGPRFERLVGGDLVCGQTPSQPEAVLASRSLERRDRLDKGIVRTHVPHKLVITRNEIATLSLGQSHVFP